MGGLTKAERFQRKLELFLKLIMERAEKHETREVKRKYLEKISFDCESIIQLCEVLDEPEPNPELLRMLGSDIDENFYWLLDDNLDGPPDINHNNIYDEAKWLRIIKAKSALFSAKERAEKYFQLSQKLIFLYKKGVFKKLEEYLFETCDIFEIKWAKGTSISDEQILSLVGRGPFDWREIVYNGISFEINGISLFVLGGNANFQINNSNDFIATAVSEKYFIEKVRGTTDLLNVKELQWFHKLSDKSKYLIESANDFLNVVFNSNADDIKDYSPLLLDFGKALEVEIKEYYKKHFSEIWPISDLFLANYDDIKKLAVWKKYKNKNSRTLLNICDDISKRREEYNPSGPKPLPYILFFLGLGIDMEKSLGIKGFLSDQEIVKVIKEISVVERLFDTSNNRNNYIHELVIDSRIEFSMHYADIILALDLIASIK